MKATTKNTAPKKPTPPKKVKGTVYFFAIEQGEPGKRSIVNMEGRDATVKAITTIHHIGTMEAYFAQTMINPKIVNFIPLREE